MNRSELLSEIEALQERIDKMGFKGQNEHDLHLREEIADWIEKAMYVNVQGKHVSEENYQIGLDKIRLIFIADSEWGKDRFKQDMMKPTEYYKEPTT